MVDQERPPSKVPKKYRNLPVRPGMPSKCIVCQGDLHPKSEHYCSLRCEQVQQDRQGSEAPAFLSKWKLRKKKAANDPLVALRNRTRSRTSLLVKRGAVKRKPCLVCGEREVIAHHEDYTKPWQVIWLCEKHHKQYHDGEIGLFGGKLWWDPRRLVAVGQGVNYPRKKYEKLASDLARNGRGSKERRAP